MIVLKVGSGDADKVPTTYTTDLSFHAVEQNIHEGRLIPVNEEEGGMAVHINSAHVVAVKVRID